MKFKQIVIFTIKAYNNNKEKEGYLPQNGTVINTYYDATMGRNVVAVGF